MTQLTTTPKKAVMPTSTAPHDLATIKHALELGLLLASLVLAVAAHGDTRLAPDVMAATGYVLPAQATDFGPKGIALFPFTTPIFIIGQQTPATDPEVAVSRNPVAY
jgi:hypothetical protein